MKLFGYSIRVELVILSLILLFVINLNMVCGCSTITAAEGFDIGNDVLQAMKDVVKKHSGYQNAKSSKEGFANAQELNGEVPKLNYFEKSNFSTECCPSKYTSSTGCACMSLDQTSELQTRGGNSPDGALL